MLVASFLRWFLVVASATTAIALGFFLLPSAIALKTVQYAGYYFIFATAAGFGLVAIRVFRRGHALTWTAADSRLGAGALALALLWQFNEVHGFKVLMDELVLSATSMSMHFDRHAFVPMKAHDLDGEYFIFGGILDKRPLLFPFLVSLLHDVTGYRPGNVFVLNGVLSAVLLFLVGRAGRLLGGSEAAGWFALLLLAGAPILGINATGGGFDLLNLVMICLHLATAIHFLRKPTPLSQDLLLLATVLLAQSRYESVLFVGTTGALLLLSWWRERRPRFSWGLVAVPLLLLTIPLQNKLFEENPGYWVSGMDREPFSAEYVFTNLGHAVNFLFTLDGFQSGSPLLSTAGIICTPFGLLYLARRWRQTLQSPELIAFLLAALVILANSVLVLFYFWGQLDDFVATRLVLPLLLLFALSSALVLGRWFAGRPRWSHGTIAVCTLWIWLAAIPFAANANSTRGFLSFQEVRYQLAFIKKHRGSGRTLYVMPRPLPALLNRKPAMTVNMLQERPEGMLHHLRLGTFNDIFIFQRLMVNPTTKVFEPTDDSKLGPEFILETVAETQLQPLFKHRISRLAAVDLARMEPRPPDWKPQYPPFKLPVPDDESATGAYIREYLETLP